MEDREGIVACLSHWIHHHFLWLLIGSYAVAAVLPGPGACIRKLGFGECVLFQEHIRLSLPTMMLGLLLLNAGLGIRATRLLRLACDPFMLAAGLLANLVVPVAFILGVAQSLRLWHNPDEVQNILVGLALVASMPVAGSSTAWLQNANGDLALSLGLVAFSTLLSPLTTPAALHAAGWVAEGVYADGLLTLAGGGTSLFLAAFVMLPSLVGMGSRGLVDEASLARAQPTLKLLNSFNLLALSYANASVALPQVVADPDWDFLAVLLVIVFAMCVLGFASGWLVARAFRADPGRQTAMMFGLGMNNNGTGLVLATAALPHLPRVMLPILVYNLVQHVVAGAADFLGGRYSPTPGSRCSGRRHKVIGFEKLFFSILWLRRKPRSRK
jgi:BASS family bile acid:Na+ symporter